MNDKESGQLGSIYGRLGEILSELKKISEQNDRAMVFCQQLRQRCPVCGGSGNQCFDGRTFKTCLRCAGTGSVTT